MIRVLVCGATGQVGQCFKAISQEQDQIDWTFCDSEKFNLLDKEQMAHFMENHPADYLVNAAAYTAVDKAEEEAEIAYEINVKGSANLARLCKEKGVHLVQISTDYVFDGHKTTPYTPLDTPNPLSVYGKTKRASEKEISRLAGVFTIVRTSWLYSPFGHNFYNTIIRLSDKKKELKIVNDQIGVPVSAIEFTRTISQKMAHKNLPQGIIHYSHQGEASWFDFARAIVEKLHLEVEVQPITTLEFGAEAPRPAYSVLENDKAFNTLDWEEALNNIIERY